jgi:hypothetical protein
MKASGLLAVSLAVNAAAIAGFALNPSAAPAAVRRLLLAEKPVAATSAAPASLESPISPARGARRAAPVLWDRLRTTDLATLVVRLRQAGFPPEVIREIVRAEVSARFRDRLTTLQAPAPDEPYWRDGGGFTPNNPARFEELRQVERERTTLLRELLADEFFSTNDVTAAQRRQFGNLSRQKTDEVQRIEDDYAAMFSQVRAATGNVMLPEDRAKLDYLTRERLADLATVLTPEELADYDVRSSPITNLLRNQLGGFNPTEAEFRAIFEMQRALNERAGGGPMPSFGFDQQRTLQTELDAKLKTALGEVRHADYWRETNREYQQLNRLVERENLPSEAATRAYALRDSVAEASNRIFDDPALAMDAKRAALQALANDTRGQVLGILGPAAGPAYLQVAEPWLRNVERGAAVRFDGAGGSMMGFVTIQGGSSIIALGGGSPNYRRLPPVRPPSP